MKKLIFFSMTVLAGILASCDREYEKSEWEIREERMESRALQISHTCKDCILIDSLGLEWSYEIQERIAKRPLVILYDYNIFDVIKEDMGDSSNYVLKMEHSLHPKIFLRIMCTKGQFDRIYPKLSVSELIIAVRVIDVSKPDFSLSSFGNGTADEYVFMDFEAPRVFILKGTLSWFEEI
jgi:hypothetical protein